MLNSSFRIYLLRNFCVITQIKDHGCRTLHRSSTSSQNECGNSCDGSDRNLEMDPACKVALITGGTRGIGFAIASQLLKAGAKNVAITGLDGCTGRDAVHKLNGTFGKKKAMFIGSSVTCMIQLEEAFKTAKETFNGLDIVVNSAGIFDGKNWENEIVTNLVGTIRGTLLAYQYMGKENKGKGGVVVNLCGISGICPYPQAPTYAATQHGILGLSRSFGDALHRERSGIRVVSLLTGLTQTDFLKGIEKRGMTPFLGQEIAKFVANGKKQNAHACGQALVHLIKCGPNGSVWAINGSRLFELNIPKWTTYRKLAAQYI